MKKKLFVAMALLAVFIVVSLRSINEPQKKQRSEYHSTELRKVVTQDGNIERTDYLDEDGNLRIAADVGYATKLIVQTSNSKIETYLDDNGERISQYAGYYAIQREYDAAGNIIRVTYLDDNNDPVNMSLKYAVEERAFNELGQQVSCRYFDTEGKPAKSSNNGFGMRYEYDEKGKKIRIIYIDGTGEPMILPSGYCILEREYYETNGPENGKIKRESYFLPDGTPALLSLGQYGVYKEYNENGQVSLMTYLNAAGSPIVTNKGYTTVTFTYYADNSVQSTLYYDINGNPFRMSEGQYGIKNKNGQTVYLNADGTEQFNVKNFVHNRSEFVIAIASVIVVLSAFTDRKMNWLMLIIYAGVILYFTLMFRETGQRKIGLLHSYRAFFRNAEVRASIIKNIWLFIPLGAILYRLFPRTTILFVPILISVAIEAVQYLTGTGFCELDDVISNSMGGVIGYGMAFLFQSIRRQFCNNLIT